MTIWPEYFILHILLMLYESVVLSTDKESTSKSFVKIRPSVLNKLAVLRQIKMGGGRALCCHGHILLNFYGFF